MNRRAVARMGGCAGAERSRYGIPGVRTMVPLALLFAVLAGAVGEGRAQGRDPFAAPESAPNAAPERGGEETPVEPLPWALRTAIQDALYNAEPDLEAPPSCPVVRANNPSQQLEAIFDCRAFRIEHRLRGEILTWGLQLRGLGRGPRLEAIPLAEPLALGNRVESQRGRVLEWFVNDPRGIEQGFTIPERPDGPKDEWLRLELAVIGDLVPVAKRGGKAIAFRRESGGDPVLHYESLSAVDAEGRVLPSVMAAEGPAGDSKGVLRLTVVDADAVYPIEIDPWVVSAASRRTAPGTLKH